MVVCIKLQGSAFITNNTKHRHLQFQWKQVLINIWKSIFGSFFLNREKGVEMGNLASKSQTNTSRISSETAEKKIENELNTAEVSFGEEAGAKCLPVEQTPLTKKIATHFAQSELNQNATETPFHLMRKKILQDLGHADSIDPRSPSQRIPRTPLNIQKADDELNNDISQCAGSPDDSCAAFNKKLADIMLDDCDDLPNKDDGKGCRDGITDEPIQKNDTLSELERSIQQKNEFRAEEPDNMVENEMVTRKTDVGLTKQFVDSKIHLTSLNKRAVVSSRIPLSVINQRGITPMKKKSSDFKNEI